MPPSRAPIKARVEVPARVADRDVLVTLASDEKGVTRITIDNVDIRFDDEVLMDALARVQQPDFDAIGIMPPMPGGGYVGRVPSLRVDGKHEETFEGVFEAGQEKTLQVHPACVFRANRIEIDECDDEDVILKSLKVGVHEQLTDDPFPLKTLSDFSPLPIEDCLPGMLITFRLENRSKETRKVKFRLLGDRLG